MTLDECFQQIELYESQLRQWRRQYENSGDSDGDGNPIDPGEQAHLDQIDNMISHFHRALSQFDDVHSQIRRSSFEVRRAENHVVDRIDSMQESLADSARELANRADGIPVAEQMADVLAEAVDQTTQITAGGLQAATSQVAGAASMAVNPVDPVVGIGEMVTHLPAGLAPLPVSVIRDATTAHNAASEGRDVSQAMEQQTIDDGTYWQNVSRELIRPYQESAAGGDYGQGIGRGVLDIVGTPVGGGRGIGAIDDAARASNRAAGLADEAGDAARAARASTAPPRSAGAADEASRPASTADRSGGTGSARSSAGSGPHVNLPSNPNAPSAPPDSVPGGASRARSRTADERPRVPDSTSRRAAEPEAPLRPPGTNINAPNGRPQSPAPQLHGGGAGTPPTGNGGGSNPPSNTGCNCDLRPPEELVVQRGTSGTGDNRGVTRRHRRRARETAERQRQASGDTSTEPVDVAHVDPHAFTPPEAPIQLRPQRRSVNRGEGADIRRAREARERWNEQNPDNPLYVRPRSDGSET